MSASKITGYRSPRHLAIFREIAKDKADTLAGDCEFPFVFRGKLRQTPTDLDDLRITKTKKYYECTERDPSEWYSFDTSKKINRLRQRRVSRKFVASFVSLNPEVTEEILPYEEV